MLLICSAPLSTTEMDPGPAKLGMAIGVKAISSCFCSDVEAPFPVAVGCGNSMPKPTVAMIRPPAIRMPGIDIPKKSIIAEPRSKKTTRMKKA